MVHNQNILGKIQNSLATNSHNFTNIYKIVDLAYSAFIANRYGIL